MAELRTPRAAPSHIPRKGSFHGRAPPSMAFVHGEPKEEPVVEETTSDPEPLKKGPNNSLPFSGARTSLPSDSAVIHMGRYYSAEELSQFTEKKPQKVTQWRFLARSLSTSNLHTTSIHLDKKKKVEVKKGEKREGSSLKQGLSWSEHIVKLVSDKEPKRELLQKSASVRIPNRDAPKMKPQHGGRLHAKRSGSCIQSRPRSSLELNEMATHFSISGGDLAELVTDDLEFHKLKASLRNSGAVTNSVLKMGLHFYIKETQERKKQQNEFRDLDLSSYGSWKSPEDDDFDEIEAEKGHTEVQLEWEIPVPAGFACNSIAA